MQYSPKKSSHAFTASGTALDAINADKKRLEERYGRRLSFSEVYLLVREGLTSPKDRVLLEIDAFEHRAKPHLSPAQNALVQLLLGLVVRSFDQDDRTLRQSAIKISKLTQEEWA